MSNTPGINIDVPEKAPFSGPIPIIVTMVADMKVFNVNNGILDNALDIALVRRDAPGLKFISKLDPHVWMEPETPLPPPPPGTDPDNAGFINEERRFDVLDYGADHDGAADYYVLASFAGWTARASLAVEHKTHSLAPGESMQPPPIGPGGKAGIPYPPDTPGILIQFKEEELPRVEGGLRVPVKQPKFPDEELSEPFVTIVVVRLGPEGGMWGMAFSLDSKSGTSDHGAQFSIPLSSFLSELNPGDYRIFAFSSDEYSDPIDFQVPDNE